MKRRLAALALTYLLALTVCAQNPTFRAQNVTTGGAPSNTPYILTYSGGTPRNNFTGCVGFQFTTVGGTPQAIAELGRYVVSGNSGTHTVYVYKNGDGSVLTSASINTSGATPGTIKYVSVTPVTPASLTGYTICSAETNGGDQWLDDDLTISSVTGGIVGSHDFSGGNTTVPPTVGNNFSNLSGLKSYGLVNFKVQ